MGKGGGKCASREQSASFARTPRLPAARLTKPPVTSSMSTSKPSFSKEKAVDCDPSTLLPLIPKKESNSSSVAKIDDDDGIDTNVSFDQGDLDSSESERRLPGASSSASIYNTESADPALPFSSGGRNPGTEFLSGDGLQKMASVSRVVDLFEKMPPKHLEAGANPPEPLVVTLRRVNNDDDLFLVNGASVSTSSTNTGTSSSGLRKRNSIAGSSSSTLEVRNLTTSSSFPAPVGHLREMATPSIISKVTGESIALRGCELRKETGNVDTEMPVTVTGELTSFASQGADASKNTLGDNWEMVSPVHQSKGLGPAWVSVPRPIITETELDVPSAQGCKERAAPEQVRERRVESTEQPTEGPLENISKDLSAIPIAKGIKKSNNVPDTADEEAETLNSAGSDHSDHIETQSLHDNYIFLGITDSSKRKSSPPERDHDAIDPEPTTSGNNKPQTNKAEDGPHGQDYDVELHSPETEPALRKELLVREEETPLLDVACPVEVSDSDRIKDLGPTVLDMKQVQTRGISAEDAKEQAKPKLAKAPYLYKQHSVTGTDEAPINVKVPVKQVVFRHVTTEVQSEDLHLELQQPTSEAKSGDGTILADGVPSPVSILEPEKLQRLQKSLTLAYVPVELASPSEEIPAIDDTTPLQEEGALAETPPVDSARSSNVDFEEGKVAGAMPDVVAEENAPVVQSREVGLPLPAPELLLEDKESPVVAEEAALASALKAEDYVGEEEKEGAACMAQVAVEEGEVDEGRVAECAVEEGAAPEALAPVVEEAKVEEAAALAGDGKEAAGADAEGTTGETKIEDRHVEETASPVSEAPLAAEIMVAEAAPDVEVSAVEECKVELEEALSEPLSEVEEARVETDAAPAEEVHEGDTLVTYEEKVDNSGNSSWRSLTAEIGIGPSLSSEEPEVGTVTTPAVEENAAPIAEKVLETKEAELTAPDVEESRDVPGRAYKFPEVAPAHVSETKGAIAQAVAAPINAERSTDVYEEVAAAPEEDDAAPLEEARAPDAEMATSVAKETTNEEPNRAVEEDDSVVATPEAQELVGEAPERMVVDEIVESGTVEAVGDDDSGDDEKAAEVEEYGDPEGNVNPSGENYVLTAGEEVAAVGEGTHAAVETKTRAEVEAPPTLVEDSAATDTEVASTLVQERGAGGREAVAEALLEVESAGVKAVADDVPGIEENASLVEENNLPVPDDEASDMVGVVAVDEEVAAAVKEVAARVEEAATPVVGFGTPEPEFGVAEDAPASGEVESLAPVEEVELTSLAQDVAAIDDTTPLQEEGALAETPAIDSARISNVDFEEGKVAGAMPDVVAEENAPVVQSREVGLPLPAPELLLEDKESPVVAEEAALASALKAEDYVGEEEKEGAACMAQVAVEEGEVDEGRVAECAVEEGAAPEALAPVVEEAKVEEAAALAGDGKEAAGADAEGTTGETKIEDRHVEETASPVSEAPLAAEIMVAEAAPDVEVSAVEECKVELEEALSEPLSEVEEARVETDAASAEEVHEGDTLVTYEEKVDNSGNSSWRSLTAEIGIGPSLSSEEPEVGTVTTPAVEENAAPIAEKVLETKEAELTAPDVEESRDVPGRAYKFPEVAPAHVSETKGAIAQAVAAPINAERSTDVYEEVAAAPEEDDAAPLEEARAPDAEMATSVAKETTNEEPNRAVEEDDSVVATPEAQELVGEAPERMVVDEIVESGTVEAVGDDDSGDDEKAAEVEEYGDPEGNVNPSGENYVLTAGEEVAAVGEGTHAAVETKTRAEVEAPPTLVEDSAATDTEVASTLVQERGAGGREAVAEALLEVESAGVKAVADDVPGIEENASLVEENNLPVPDDEASDMVGVVAVDEEVAAAVKEVAARVEEAATPVVGFGTPEPEFGVAEDAPASGEVESLAPVEEVELTSLAQDVAAIDDTTPLQEEGALAETPAIDSARISNVDFEEGKVAGAMPDVVAEENAPVVQSREVGLPLPAPELLLEDKESPVVAEEAALASALKAEDYVGEEEKEGAACMAQVAVEEGEVDEGRVAECAVEEGAAPEALAPVVEEAKVEEAAALAGDGKEAAGADAEGTTGETKIEDRHVEETASPVSEAPLAAEIMVAEAAPDVEVSAVEECKVELEEALSEPLSEVEEARVETDAAPAEEVHEGDTLVTYEEKVDNSGNSSWRSLTAEIGIGPSLSSEEPEVGTVTTPAVEENAAPIAEKVLETKEAELTAPDVEESRDVPGRAYKFPKVAPAHVSETKGAIAQAVAAPINAERSTDVYEEVAAAPEEDDAAPLEEARAPDAEMATSVAKETTNEEPNRAVEEDDSVVATPEAQELVGEAPERMVVDEIVESGTVEAVGDDDSGDDEKAAEVEEYGDPEGNVNPSGENYVLTAGEEVAAVGEGTHAAVETKTRAEVEAPPTLVEDSAATDTEVASTLVQERGAGGREAVAEALLEVESAGVKAVADDVPGIEENASLVEENNLPVPDDEASDMVGVVAVDEEVAAAVKEVAARVEEAATPVVGFGTPEPEFGVAEDAPASGEVESLAPVEEVELTSLAQDVAAIDDTTPLQEEGALAETPAIDSARISNVDFEEGKVAGAMPDVVAEENAPVVQSREVGLPLPAPELLLEDKESPVVAEEAALASALKAEDYVGEEEKEGAACMAQVAVEEGEVDEGRVAECAVEEGAAPEALAPVVEEAKVEEAAALAGDGKEAAGADAEGTTGETKIEDRHVEETASPVSEAPLAAEIMVAEAAPDVEVSAVEECKVELEEALSEPLSEVEEARVETDAAPAEEVHEGDTLVTYEEKVDNSGNSSWRSLTAEIGIGPSLSSEEPEVGTVTTPAVEENAAPIAEKVLETKEAELTAPDVEESRDVPGRAYKFPKVAPAHVSETKGAIAQAVAAPINAERSTDVYEEVAAAPEEDDAAPLEEARAPDAEMATSVAKETTNEEPNRAVEEDDSVVATPEAQELVGEAPERMVVDEIVESGTVEAVGDDDSGDDEKAAEVEEYGDPEGNVNPSGENYVLTAGEEVAAVGEGTHAAVETKTRAEVEAPPTLVEDSAATDTEVASTLVQERGAGGREAVAEALLEVESAGVKAVADDVPGIEENASLVEENNLAVPLLELESASGFNFQPIWNLCFLKKRPVAVSFKKCDDCPLHVNFKVDKVVGLSWPPAPLMSAMDDDSYECLDDCGDFAFGVSKGKHPHLGVEDSIFYHVADVSVELTPSAIAIRALEKDIGTSVDIGKVIHSLDDGACLVFDGGEEYAAAASA